MTTVAIMQPYFVPYAGYFGLFAGADAWVLLDDVQFPRRGWVHRNALPDALGRPKWLTLPLRKERRDVRICDLRFRDDARAAMDEQLPAFPLLRKPGRAQALVDALPELEGTVVDYLESTLRITCGLLGLSGPVCRSSSLGIDPALRAADRILAIAEAMGARSYLNASGGRALYEPATFAARGIELRFLPPYRGPTWSILARLIEEDATMLGREIVEYAAAAGP